MKKLKLLFLAASPFVIGYLLNYIMIRFNLYGTSVVMIRILFFVYWFFVGSISTKYTESIRESILMGNSFAIVSIILIIFQEVVMGRYMLNIIGTAPQMFYLGTLSLTSKLENILLFFMPIHYMWMTYSLAFVLMILVYYKGYTMRRKSKKSEN